MLSTEVDTAFRTMFQKHPCSRRCPIWWHMHRSPALPAGGRVHTSYSLESKESAQGRYSCGALSGCWASRATDVLFKAAYDDNDGPVTTLLPAGQVALKAMDISLRPTNKKVRRIFATSNKATSACLQMVWVA